MKNTKDPFENKNFVCEYSPTGYCGNRGNLTKCISEKRCCQNKERPFEKKIIKK
jgi:hypothetical protein